MTAAAKRAIHRDLTRAWAKTVQYLGHHDRQVYASRRLARSEDLLQVVWMLLGMKFFVLLAKGAWVLARITQTTPVGGLLVGGTLGHTSSYSGQVGL
jgi:hypothetical protein